MQRKSPKSIFATLGAAQARRIVADHHELIAKLKASASITRDADQSLRGYISEFKIKTPAIKQRH
jgi:hypothetical protein